MCVCACVCVRERERERESHLCSIFIEMFLANLR